MPRGKQPTWAHSSRPRPRAPPISASSRNTRSGSFGSMNIAAIITGRPLFAAMLSSHGIVEVMPLVSMNTPLPASPSTPVSSCISCSSASREGIGIPASPLCCSRVEVANPIAPASIASATRRFISATSASVAARSDASSPRAQVLTEECPMKEATFGTMPLRSSMSRYCGYVSKSQSTPASSASSDMPSTWVRLRRVRSRSRSRHGAMVKPQLPMTTVVTPRPTDGVAHGSHVSWASKWVWMSTIPGARARPCASTISLPAPTSSPISAMRPSRTAMSPSTGPPPSPSNRRVFLITKSCIAYVSSSP